MYKDATVCEQLDIVCTFYMQYRPQARRVGRPALSIIHSPIHRVDHPLTRHSGSATQNNSVFKSNSQLEMCLDSRPFFHMQGWVDFNTRHSSVYKEGFPDPLPREGLMLMIECPCSTRTQDFLLSASGMDFQILPVSDCRIQHNSFINDCICLGFTSESPALQCIAMH